MECEGAGVTPSSVTQSCSLSQFLHPFVNAGKVPLNCGQVLTHRRLHLEGERAALLSGSGTNLGEDRKHSLGEDRRHGGEFPGGPVARTLHVHCWGPGSVPGWGTKIPQATQQSQIRKKKWKQLVGPRMGRGLGAPWT